LLARIPEVLRSRRVTLMDLHLCDDCQGTRMNVLVPILDDMDSQAAPLGLVVLRIDPATFLYPYLNTWPTPSASAETLIVRREGNAVVYLNQLRFHKDAAVKLRLPLAGNQDLPTVQAALGREGVVQGTDYRGVPVIAAIRPIPDSPWFLVARMDIAEAYAPLRDRWWMMLALVAVVLGAGGAGLGLAVRQQRLHFYQEQYLASEALRQSEERHRTILQTAQDGFWLADARGQLLEVNQTYCRMSGYSEQELLTMGVADLKVVTAPDDVATSTQMIVAQGQARFECQHRRKDGSIFDVEVSVQHRHTEGGRFVAFLKDITERKALEAELKASARTDRLTGLPNRALLCDRLQMAVLRARRLTDYHFAVLFLDFDRFKTINDSLGHQVGDLLLQQIAQRLRTTVRSGDSLSRQARQHTTARLGGDEFVVLLDGLADPADAAAVAERLLTSLAQPYYAGDHKVYATASVGIVTSAMPAAGPDDLLRDADTAMYEAKLAGRGQYVVFDIAMRERVQNRLHLENDLRQAVDAGQLFLMYQPIVSLQTGQVEGFEALVRWKHPARGLISPGQFIPIAEDTGLIIPVGEWVLRQACAQFVRWRQSMGPAAPPSINVNLSRNQLVLPDLAERIKTILEQTGMAPGDLHLEVTESAVMKDAAAATGVLRAIHDLGVKVDMDDFGTGYSSLACLHQFPLDVLKIDRSFVANIDRGRDFAALVHAVTQLAQNLNIKVVAEGIETLNQLLVLQSLDCELGQGYWFSKPLMPDQVPSFHVPPALLPGQAA
jgi:diguanylate cyclase (GGDEF)-like protein/PAS domain S-box-containing protein